MRLSRLMLSLGVLSALLTPAIGTTPAAAQPAPVSAAPSPCAGTVNIIRVSDIKPGMMQKFLEAAAAQQAWYKAAGTSDQIVIMRVMVQDPTTKAWSLSDIQAMTNHTVASGPTKAAHDAAWDAFVAKYAESSTIKTQYMACTPAM